MAWSPRREGLFRSKDGGQIGGPLPSSKRKLFESYHFSNWKDNNPLKKPTDPSEKDCSDAVDWLASQFNTKFEFRRVDLKNPTDLEVIYETSRSAVEKIMEDDDFQDYTFNISSGTWAMAVSWSILSKTRVKLAVLLLNLVWVK